MNVEGLEGYGTNDIYPVVGSVYLWLPDGEHWFALSDRTTTHRYHAVVKGLDVTVDPIDGRFFVNGEGLVLGSGTGWNYDENGVLSLDISEAPGVQPTDGHRRLPIIVPPVLPES